LNGLFRKSWLSKEPKILDPLKEASFMQIQLKDIDPELAAHLVGNAQARMVLGMVPPSNIEAPKITPGRITLAVLGGLFAVLGSLVVLGFGVEHGIPDWLITIFFFAGVFGVCQGGANWLHSGDIFKKTTSGQAVATAPASFLESAQEKPLSVEQIRAFRATSAFSPQQTQYLQVLGSLLQLNRQGQIDDKRGAALLVHLNGLLQSERELQAQVKSVDSLLQADQIKQIEAEEKELQEKLQAVRDPEARQDLEKSLEICQTRLSGLSELSPLLERLDAQRRVVQQTLASLEASLSRMQITRSNDVNSGAESLSVESIQESITEIQREARSTEQAVQEVMALRAS
jgi:hypothetical protein